MMRGAKLNSGGGRIHGIPIVVLALAAGAGAWAAAATDQPASNEARRILEATGVKGGFIVHVGCGDGELTAALRAGDAFVVQALDTDPASVAKTRQTAAAGGLAGPVSAAVFDGKRLPCVDNLANLVVSENLGGIPMDEVMRALAPNGVAYVKSSGNWTKTVKPWPKEIDEWTHYLHGPDGNAVANDSVIGPPVHLQWAGAPQHSKSHKHLTTVNVMVSSGGRLFYIVDEGPTALAASLPSRWALFARDAFNGVVLWRHPLSSWQPSNVPSRNLYPVDLHRRLVAGKDRVFATLSILGPVASLDAASGETLMTYPNTEKTEEIILADGVLFLVVNNAAAGQIDRRRMAYEHAEPRQKRIMAVRAESGAVLWEKSGQDTDGLMPMTLACRNKRVYFQNTENIMALDAQTGKELWRSARPADYLRPGWCSPTLVAYDKAIISADRKAGPGQPTAKDDVAGGETVGDLVAFSAETGARLWTIPCAEGDRSPTDVFGVNGLMWCGQVLDRKEQDYRKAYDLLTGAVVRETPLSDGWVDYHHHRCYGDKATENYILSGRTGVEFIDLKTGEITANNWIRGNCKNGILPCNGLIYLPPEQCGCYVEGKLTGFHAVAPARRTKDEGQGTKEPRLEKGPAFGKIDDPKSEIENPADWPTYRKDAARSGRTAAPVSPDLKQAWEARLGGKLTPPVVAQGRLFAASIDSHVLYALEADTGKTLWTYETGARIDSPPTIAGGLAVFGCRDGWVYALRAADGQLAWRFRAAPEDSSLIADDQVESVWPVTGSVLIQDGVVYCVAGRNSFIDGGVWMYKLDLATGKPLLEKNYYSRDPQTGKTVELYKPYPAEIMAERELPGVLPDVPSSDGKRIWMRAVTFDRDLVIQNEYPPHLFCSMGFLDDSWWERTYWIYGRHIYGGAAGVHYAKSLFPAARIMVCDEANVYGYRDETFSPAGLFASAKDPNLAEKSGGSGKSKRRKTGDAPQTTVVDDWRGDAPLYAQGLVLAGETLFAAGPPRFDEDTTREWLANCPTDDREGVPAVKDALDTFEGKKGALLWAVSKTDGKKMAECKLSSVPVFDGLIAANGRLYVSTKTGTVACLSGL